MLDHVAPECVLRAVDTQLRAFITMAFGGVGAKADILAALQRTKPDSAGAILEMLIVRYDEIVDCGCLQDDTVLRYAEIVSPMKHLSRTACCTASQLRAAYALLDATAVPGHAECLQVVACRALIEAELSAG